MANGKRVGQAPSEEQLALNAIARGVAYLAMHAAELSNSDLATKAGFLERMGLSRSDCAKLLETSENSIRSVLARKKKGARRG